MPDTNHQANPKARMGIGDMVTAEIDLGTKITIMRTDKHYRVTMLDTWGRPLRDAANFPGSDHHQERAARDHAATLYRDICSPEDPVTWTIYRAATRQRYITHHNQPAGTKQLQLI